MALIQGAFGGSSVGPQGPEGPQGPPGPVGPVGLEWRGQWSSSESYIIDDAVGYNGASYFCISNNTGTPPTEQPTDTNWALLAAEGMQGPKGNPGMVWRGLWLPSVQYVKDDAVLYSSLGGSFIAISDNIGTPPTGTISDPNWSYLAARGLQGQDGPQGPAGTPAPVVDTFLLDIFNWTGSQTIANAAFLNFLSLSGLNQQSGGTAGVTVASGVAKLPPKTKPSGVTFSTRISGTASGAAGTAREWKIQARRSNGATVVGSTDASKTTGNDISNRDAVLESHTSGSADPFTTEGVIIGLQNDSGATITLTSVSVRIYRQVNPE